MPSKYPTPNLSNATISHIVDECKRYREMKAEADFYDKFYSTALKARMRKNALGLWVPEQSDLWLAELTESSQARISPDLCREILDAETLAKVTVSISVATLRFTKRATEKKEAE